MDLVFLRHASERVNANALSTIADLIENTAGVLRVAVAYFTHPMIAKKIINRAGRNRHTLLLVNSSDLLRPVEGHVEYEVSQALLEVLNRGRRDQYIEVRTLGLPHPEYHNMHHKFAVGDDQVLFGSANWTKAALEDNYEWLALGSEPEVVRQFREEFDFLWARAHDLSSDGQQVRVIVCPKCRRSDSVDFESWGACCIACGTQFRPKHSGF